MVRSLFGPALRFFNRRFAHLDDRFGDVDGRLDGLAASLAASLEHVDWRLDRLDASFQQFERTALLLSSDVETAFELLFTVERLLGLPAEDRPLSGRDNTRPRLIDTLFKEMTGEPLERLGDGAASYLNWATGHEGPMAQAGIWFNPPIRAGHREGQVEIVSVNERAYEVPYALAAAGGLAPGATVLDVGSAESLLPLYLASLGFDVLAVDPRPYPLSHPKVTSVVAGVEVWEGPPKPLDAIFCISTLEHIGLGAYELPPSEVPEVDRVVINRFREWLSPGGELIFTAPYGVAAQSDFERVYDLAGLDRLFKGWKILDRRLLRRTDDLHWEDVDRNSDAEDWQASKKGVVMLRATPA